MWMFKTAFALILVALEDILEKPSLDRLIIDLMIALYT